MSPVEDTTSKHVCTVCNVSFTRKTHLTRHVRSHLNQRTYNCTICGKATFTRSDLLTRHVKRCTLNPGGVAPSRRKACQCCILRKVKCDFKRPCSKCVARGEECVYQKPGRHTTGVEDDGPSQDDSATFSSVDGLDLESDANRDVGPSAGGLSPSLDSSMSLLMASLLEGMVPFPGNSPADPTATPNLMSGPSTCTPKTTAAQFLAQPIADSTYSSEVISGPLPSSGLVTSQTTSESFIDIHSAFLDYFLNQAAGSTASTLSPEGLLQEAFFSVPRPFAPADQPLTDALPPGMDKYLTYFFTLHCRQYPFLHIPTWSQCTAPPLLTRVMRVCGALHATGDDAEGRAADQFILGTLRSGLREQIFRTFAETPGNDVDMQAALILAMGSIQNLGLFHRFPDERSVATAYNGMIVTMLRRSAISAVIQSWQMPPLDPLDPHTAWISWARYENLKRILAMVYLHDTLMPVFNNIPPSFGDSELDPRLPCDDDLWQAPDAHAWLQRLTSSNSTSPSAYDVKTRLVDYTLSTVLADMLGPLHFIAPTPLNRFASFIVIHALLRAIYLSKSGDYEQRLAIQHALTQWYVGWLSGATGVSQARLHGYAEPDFTSAVLVLYWLAQTWLNHVDNSGPVSQVGQVRFQTAKRWLKDFWLLLRDAGEFGVGVRLMGAPDPSAGHAFVEELPAVEEGENKTHPGLLEWIPVLT